jgi:DNA-binding response OmpR family regulator
MRLLIIFDDVQFAEKLNNALNQLSYAVDLIEFENNDQFWSRTTDYDLIILEHSTPQEIIETCIKIRQSGKQMPLLVVIESLTSEEAIAMFNCGIDDYTSKFNHCSEIAARVRAMLRRGPNQAEDKFTIDDLILDCRSYSVSRGQQTVHLTKKEFGLLEYLLRHPNQVMSRTALIEHVWDINADLFSNSLETHILNLRKKIEAPNRPKLIHTISGRGYKIATQK